MGSKKDLDATHVISEVTYGFNAFLMFEKAYDKNEQAKEIGGSLHVLIKKIPTMVIDVGEKSAQFEFRNRIRSTSNIKVPSQLRRGERIRFTIKGYRFRARAFSVRYRNLRYPTQGLRIDNNNS